MMFVADISASDQPRCRRRVRVALWLALVVGGATACAGAPAPKTVTPSMVPTPAAPGSVASSASASASVPVSVSSTTSVRQLIGTPACRVDADCRTIAVGHKACGGPEGYLAWSPLQTDPQALAAAVARDTAAQVERNRGTVSTCTFVADPGAVCQGAAPSDVASAGPDTSTPAGRCTLRQRGVRSVY